MSNRLSFLVLLLTLNCLLPLRSFAAETDSAELRNTTETPTFHFNFQASNGQKEWGDASGRTKLVSPVPLVEEKGALRIDYGAKISIPGENVSDLAGDFSLSAWIVNSKVGAFGVQPYNPLFSKGFHPGQVELQIGIKDGFPLYTYTSGRGYEAQGISPIGTSYGNTTRYPDPKWVQADPQIKEHTWTHLAFVKAGSTLSIFKDGVLVVKRTDAPQPLKPSAEPLLVGSERLKGENDNLNTANILINDIRMYPSALTAEDIKAVYEAEKGSYPAGYIGLTSTRAYYPEQMRDYSYDLETKLDIVEEYQKKLPVDPYLKQSSMTGAVQASGTGLQLQVNDQPTYPMAVFPNQGYVGEKSLTQSTRMVRDFAAAGTNVVTVSFGYTSVFWQGENRYDWTKVDQAFNEHLKANPQAKFIASVFMSPPDWFLKKYPDELEKYYYNDEDPTAGLKSWPNSAPLSSQIWRDLSCKAIEDFVRHIEAQPYANHVFDYHIASGDAGEWYWAASFTGGMPGYSTPTRDGFRKWLRTRYQDDKLKLQTAWQQDAIDFETVEVPTPAERKASEHGIFRDALKARKVLDFRQYMNDTTLSILRQSVATAKAASGRRKIVSTYYGYSLLFAGKGETLHKGGIGNLGDVLALDDLDVVATPIDYVERRGGQPGLNINAFAGSARLHNKFVWREEDLRTHFWPRFEFGRTSSTEESIGVITRDFGHSLTNDNTGLWFMAMAGNAAFHQNAMMEAIQKASKVAAQSLTQDRKSIAEVALIFDEKSLMQLSVQSGKFIDDHCWGTYRNASMMGAPFDVYLLNDLDKIPDRKLYIFLNSYAVDEATMRAIQQKVRRNNAVAVWCYAPGYIRDDKFSVESMLELTGFTLKETTGMQGAALQPVDKTHAIMKYSKAFPAYSFAPAFEVTDEAAKVLANVGGKPALTVREVKGATPAAAWRSVYSLMPLTTELLTGLCDYAGVHVYSKSFDVMGANRSYLMLHGVTGGKKEITLPRKSSVYNALTEQKIASQVSSFTDTLASQETRVYRLGP